MSTVWILTRGEMGEGATILGVYATKGAAKGAFASAARQLTWGIDGAEQDPETGAITLESGCDLLELTPHQVLSHPELPGGGDRG